MLPAVKVLALLVLAFLLAALVVLALLLLAVLNPTFNFCRNAILNSLLAHAGTPAAGTHGASAFLLAALVVLALLLLALSGAMPSSTLGVAGNAIGFCHRLGAMPLPTCGAMSSPILACPRLHSRFACSQGASTPVAVTPAGSTRGASTRAMPIPVGSPLAQSQLHLFDLAQTTLNLWRNR
jgi:hypothetical protein